MDHLKNFLENVFLWRSPEKFLRRPFFFLESACVLWFLALASSIPVLGLESVCPRKGCPWPRIFFVSLASSLVSSTPPLASRPLFSTYMEKFILGVQSTLSKYNRLTQILVVLLLRMSLYCVVLVVITSLLD